MNQDKKEILTNAGIQVDEVLARFMENEALLNRFLKKFLEDTTYDQLFLAIKSKNMEQAFQMAHTLKGVSGNLSMISLFQLVSLQTDLLRQNEMEKAIDLMPEVTEAYETVKEAIQTYLL